MSDTKVESPVSSLVSSLIAWSVASSNCVYDIRVMSYLQYNAWRQIIGMQHRIYNTDWLLCWIGVFSQGVLLESSVNSDSSLV
jgi:hypothetical protein